MKFVQLPGVSSKPVRFTLLIFIVWDIFKPVRPKPTEGRASYRAQPGQLNWPWLGAAALGCMVYGIYLWETPPTRPFGGRRSYELIMEFAVSQLGEKGPAVIWLCFGCIGGAVIMAAWRASSTKDL
jgi:hypothetical protein